MYTINMPGDESHGKTLIRFLVQSNPYMAGEVAAFVPELAKWYVNRTVEWKDDDTERKYETKVAEYYEPTEEEKKQFKERGEDCEMKVMEIEEQHEEEVKAKIKKRESLKSKKSKK